MKNPLVEYVHDLGISCGHCHIETEINPNNGLCENCDNSYQPEILPLPLTSKEAKKMAKDKFNDIVIFAIKKLAKVEPKLHDKIQEILGEYEYGFITVAEYQHQIIDAATKYFGGLEFRYKGE